MTTIPADDGSATTHRLTPEARRTTAILLLGVLAIAAYAAWEIGALVTGGLQGPEWAVLLLMVAVLLCSPAVAWTLLAERQLAITSDATGLTVRAPGVTLQYTWAQVGAISASAPPLPLRGFAGDKARSAGRSAEPGSPPEAIPIGMLDNHIIEGNDVPGGTMVAAPGVPETNGDTGDGPLYLHVAPPPAQRITQPLARLLWQGAYGDTIPLPAGLTARAALVRRVR